LFEGDKLLVELRLLGQLGLDLPLLRAAATFPSCWSRMAIYDSAAALIISVLSPDAVRMEWISKLASPFLTAPDLYFSIHSEHFMTTGDCGLSTPGGGEACSETGSLDMVSAVVPVVVSVLGDGD
jgi:hypothetical protein